MKLFECHPSIRQYASVETYFTEIGLCEDDLLLTNRFLLDAEKVNVHGAQVIYQENFGAGEPTDRMLMAILGAVRRPYRRVFGIGGGTVMDLAKLLCLDYSEIRTTEELHQLMMNRKPTVKKCPVLLSPTTCGTGSEVTNVAVLLLESLNVKMGLANDALYASVAALIPSLVLSLPYRPMILSAIDALIHAVESWLSPKANELTRVFSREAITVLLHGFRKIGSSGKADEAILSSFLSAATMAGLAFGNAGCGAVHAMSYPIGGTWHLPHGESNYEVFLPVLRYYDTLAEKQPLEQLKAVLAEVLDTSAEEALDVLESLLAEVFPRRPLADLGADEALLTSFAADVWEKQQRLLGNAMRVLSPEILKEIYLTC